MIKPAILPPGEQVATIGHVFGTPIVVKGMTWLPLVELGMWGFLAWLAGSRDPGRTWIERLKIGLLAMPFVVGSEWGHNFAHAAAAWLVDKPMDALRITWGTPLVVYFDIEDPDVTPRQHIIRALGGPVFNAFLYIQTWAIRRMTRPDSLVRELLGDVQAANLFLLTVGLLPIPGIDGGPILKWSLVQRGRTPREADAIVRKVDGVLGAGLGVAAGVAFKKKRWLLGALLAQLAAFALSIALGWIRETPPKALHRDEDDPGRGVCQNRART